MDPSIDQEAMRIFADMPLTHQTYHRVFDYWNSVWLEFMPSQGDDIGADHVDNLGMAGDSEAAVDGRFITADGVRFNIRLYHFNSDPEIEAFERDVSIPDFIAFDAVIERFVIAISEG
jgi:hypothetical protein